MGRLKINSDYTSPVSSSVQICPDPFNSREPIASSIVLHTGINQRPGAERV